MLTDPQKFLRARLLAPALISNYGLAPAQAAQTRAPARRRTATYRAIVCALGPGAGVSQADDPIDLGALGAGGFRIDGIDNSDGSGVSVSGAGDVNGDDLPDVIIGALGADPDGNSYAGESYVVFGPAPVNGPVLLTDRERFLSATGASVASAPYSAVNRPSEPFQSGQVTFDAIAPSSLNFGNSPADFPDDNDIELAINANEDLDIARADGFTFAMGIDFASASGGSTPSTFAVTVKAGDTTIGQLQFQTDRLPAQNYLGVWAQAPFDRLEIRETTTTNENEYFGTVSTSQQPLPPPIFVDGFESGH